MSKVRARALKSVYQDDGPNFTMEFEAEIPPKNWAGLLYIYLS